jgi:hypothetical protein
VGDEEHMLERVGRPHRPALWIGAWVVGLVAIVGLAIVGRDAPVEGIAVASAALPAPLPAPVASPPPAASSPAAAIASPTLPADLPRIIRPRTLASTPRPIPTLGDDGLVGGTVYSSPGPTDWSRVVPGP